MPHSALAATVIITDADLRIRRVSLNHNEGEGNTCRTLADEMIGACLLDHLPDMDQDEALELCGTVLAGGEFPGGVKSYRKVVAKPHLMGERWILLIGPHFSDNGGVDGVVYARFRSDETIVQSDDERREIYECLVENADEAVFALDRNGIVTYVNHRDEEYSGLLLADLVGKHFSEFVHPDDVRRVGEVLDEAINTGSRLHDYEFRVVQSDGSTILVVASGRAIGSGGGRRFVGMARDVTESVEVHEKLLARNKALSALNDIMMALSSSSRLDEALQKALENILSVLCLKAGTIALREIDNALRVRAIGGVLEGVSGILGVECPIAKLCAESGELTVVTDVRNDERLDPSVREWIAGIGFEALVALPLKYGGVTTAIMSLGVQPPADLTLEQMEFLNLAAGMLGPAIENVRLREAERAKNLELEALTREAHHRIKNNLQMVAGLLYVPHGEDPGPKAMQRCLRQVQAIATVHELLSPRNVMVDLDLRDCIAKVARNALDATGLEDSVEMTVDGENRMIPADKVSALGIIINELVSNAAQHGLRGRDSGRVRIVMQRKGAKTCVDVIDNGVGLPEGFKIPRRPDCGLGLVVSLVTHGLGGEVEIRNTKEGTLARVTF